MLKMMNPGLTKKYVLDAIDVYVRVIDNEMKNALTQIDGKNNDQVKEKERRIIDTENKISSSEDEIKMLQDKIAKINEKIASDKAFIETTRQEVEQAKQEIFIDKADLEVTGTMIKNNLLADKETLTRILPDD
jgi:peptidoglycan hydrolase CwlO-like protein